jgi:non-heme Fe2+,alpha-ketoglutarate-dependent halogenase
VPKVLSAAAVEQYRSAGYYFPVRVLSEAEAAGYRRRLEEYEAGSGAPIGGPYRHKSHLLFTWLNELVRVPKILDVVEDVLGPDLLCWSTSFFIKEPGTKAYVSWHQDATYWGLSSPDVMTVWVGFTASNLESGCMKVIPGTHTTDVVPHRDTFAKDNLLTRGQEIAVEVDEKKAVDLIMRPGEASLHHVRLVHGSEPNTSKDRRIGFAIRYIPTYVRQIAGNADSATLVRGKDTHRNFEPEPRPRRDLDPETLAFHRATTDRQAKILYRGTEVQSFSRTFGRT